MINKSITYTHNHFRYKNFVSLTEDEKLTVWHWRNDENIRKWMYNRDFIPVEQHLRFVDSLITRDDCYYWLVFKDSEPYGVVYITDFDRQKNKVEVGLYRDPYFPDMGGGLDFYWNFYGLLMFDLEIDKLKAGIAKENGIAILLNSFLGFVKTGEKAVGDQFFYDAICMKTTIENDWESKNDLREMLRYYKSLEFAKW
jgi:UDP-4-amino-4,6-dideoxy-N-acetyl-beta-L-altrosamine N-acetyltransferase